MMDLDIFDEADRNSDGDLILTREGRFDIKKVNLSKLFNPGKRKTSNVQMLVIEARLADEKGELSNPAFPTTEEVGEAALEAIEAEGLEPAWLSGPVGEVY